MAKKSKSKKRRQAQKRAQEQAVSTRPANTATKVKNAANTPKKASKSQNIINKDVIIDNHLDITPEELETDQVDTLLSENPPREPISQNKILIALAVVIIILLGVLFFFYNKTNQVQTDLQKSNQEQLNGVKEPASTDGYLQSQ